MPAWSWFVIALAIGAFLLLGATALDRRARRRVTGAGEPAPHRGLDDVDRHVPSYLTQDEVDALPHPAQRRSGAVPHRGEGFAFGHAHPDFATDQGGALWRGASVMIIDGEVTSMRQLMAPLSRATGDAPLAIVAEGFHPEVLMTLAANRRALHAPVVAAAADARERRRLAELTGAEQLSTADLQAGYVPDHALGRADTWASTARNCWVEPQHGS